MLSLQLVSEIQAGTSLVTPFQPWWEILIDYSLTGILMAVLLGLAGVTLTGTTEIVCIPIVNGSLSTDLSISSYVNSRCSRTFGGSFLLYYPYIALVLYLVLLFGHIISVKLPSTSSFLELMFQLFADFKALRNSSAYFGGQAVVTNPEEQRMSNETQKGGKLYKVLKVEVKEQVIGLVERLIQTLKSNPGFFVVYVAKSVILFVGSGLVIAGNVVALVIYDWALVFDCELKMSVAALYERTTCTIPAAPFLYSLMIVTAIFSSFILILTCRAIFWLIQTRNFQSDYLQTWKQGKHVLSEQPGFRDFTFCLMLMKCNGTDGEAVYKTVNSSLQIYTSLKIEQHFEKDQLLGTSVASDVQFERDNYICDFMLREMGMQSKETGESHDLINTLSGLYDYMGINGGDKEGAEKRLRNAVVDELISHPTRYKDMIDNSKENLLTFREYVRSIKDGSFLSGQVFECNFVLMAFANCTRFKIVVLRPHLCSFVFTPLCEEEEHVKVCYLKHIPPRDYIVVLPLDEASDEQISNKDRFLESMEYAEKLRGKALKSWRSTGYKNFLQTLTSLLPKYLTGTEDVFDKVDGSHINRPVMSHLTLLEDIGFGGNEDEESEEEGGAKEDEGSMIIN